MLTEKNEANKKMIREQLKQQMLLLENEKRREKDRDVEYGQRLNQAAKDM
jgi:hypothetical protein